MSFGVRIEWNYSFSLEGIHWYSIQNDRDMLWLMRKYPSFAMQELSQGNVNASDSKSIMRDLSKHNLQKLILKFNYIVKMSSPNELAYGNGSVLGCTI